MKTISIFDAFPSAKGQLAGLLVLCAAPAWASAQVVRVGSTVHVSSDEAVTPMAETWMAVDPHDRRVMIAASMAFPADGRWATAMYRTVDGGRTWQRSVHGPRAARYFWGADPVVAFSSDGIAYYSDLEWGSLGNAPFDDEPGSHEIHANVFLYRSADGGRTWSDPIALYGDDHSSIAIDESGGKYQGRVYVSYTAQLHTVRGKPEQLLGLAYSDDGGLSYRQRLFAGPEIAARESIVDCPSATDLLVASDGTLVLAYTCEVAKGQDRVQKTWSLASIDGGRSFGEPSLAATAVFSAARRGSEDLKKVAYWPRMAIDRSKGPHRDQLYLSYEDAAHSPARIMITASRDDGRDWSDPVKVSDDRSPNDANTPAVAVSENGTVGVSWYDRRDDRKNSCYEEYFSASLDGGATFLPSVAVGGHATCPGGVGNFQPNVTQLLDVARGTYSVYLASAGPRFINGGETQGLVGLSGGGFYAAWADGFGGVMQLAATDLTVSAQPLGAEVGDLLDVRMGSPKIDRRTQTLTLRLNVINRTKRSMKAPLALVISEMNSALKGLRAANSDNGIPGVGALWRLRPASGGGSELRPGERAQPITLEFRFDQALARDSDEFPLSADFHIFESSP